MCGAQCVAMGGYVLLYVAKWPCVTTCEPVSGTSHYGSVVRSHSIPVVTRMDTPKSGIRSETGTE